MSIRAIEYGVATIVQKGVNTTRVARTSSLSLSLYIYIIYIRYTFSNTANSLFVEQRKVSISLGIRPGEPSLVSERA